MYTKPVLAGFPGRKALFDVEAYPNYILLAFQDVDSGINHTFRIDPDNDRDDRKAAEAYYRSLSVVVTYNGHGYDDHILDQAFKGLDCGSIWETGDQIIKSDRRRHSPFLRFGEKKESYPLSIDLAQVIAVYGSFPSLKLLGIYLHYPVLRELPIHPGTVLDDAQKAEIDAYNIHDMNL